MPKFEIFLPVKPFNIIQGFGSNGEYYRANGIPIDGHNGLDLRAATGTPVRAAHDGVITNIGQDGNGGETVVMRTLDERDYNDGKAYFRTIFCHLLPNSYQVKIGQVVKAGDILALSDNTGFSTGSHLHFGLKPIKPDSTDGWYAIDYNNGYLGAIDPAPYLSKIHAEDYSSMYAQLISMLKIVENLLIRIAKK